MENQNSYNQNTKMAAGKEKKHRVASVMKMALKITLTIFFLLLAGVLFWQGYNPIFEAIEAHQPIVKHIFMFLVNFFGALICLMYAGMPFFPDLFEIIKKGLK